MSDRQRPAVFLSHAGEDNDRFARGLAERLRAAGIDVWFDEWEILPGDSLVDKVFEEGLKSADAMVIVLSANSIDKPWVREEINAGFVKRVEGKCKLIPVLIDAVPVPEALASTVWQPIADTNDYDAELDRIVRAIHDDRNRAAPGERPGYAEVAALPGLYSTDTLVLREAGAMTLAADGGFVDSRALLERLGAEGVAEEAFLESLRVLEDHWYVEVHRTLGSGIAAAGSFSLTVAGLDLYASEFVPEYDEMLTKVVVELVNGEKASDREIAEATGIPRVLVEHFFDVLESRGLLRVSKMYGPTSHVFDVSPQLKRLLQGSQE